LHFYLFWKKSKFTENAKEDSSQGANSTNYYASAILADKIEILTILAFKVKKNHPR
jgi:hypothetical protein